jgi:hypothetical protein
VGLGVGVEDPSGHSIISCPFLEYILIPHSFRSRPSSSSSCARAFRCFTSTSRCASYALAASTCDGSFTLKSCGSLLKASILDLKACSLRSRSSTFRCNFAISSRSHSGIGAVDVVDGVVVVLSTDWTRPFFASVLPAGSSKVRVLGDHRADIASRPDDEKLHRTSLKLILCALKPTVAHRQCKSKDSVR